MIVVYRESPGVWVVSQGGVRRRYRTWAEAMEVADRASLRWLDNWLTSLTRRVKS